jgi:hypothetical protein
MLFSTLKIVPAVGICYVEWIYCGKRYVKKAPKLWNWRQDSDTQNSRKAEATQILSGRFKILRREDFRYFCFRIRGLCCYDSIFPFKTRNGSVRDKPMYLPIFLTLAVANMGEPWRTSG